MSRLTRLSTFGAAMCCGAVLLAGCTALGGGADSEAPPEGGGSADDHIAISGWAGCDIFDDLNPLQDFLGAEEVAGEGLLDSDPSSYERPSCQGRFYLATFVSDVHTTTTETTGDATVSLSITSAISAEEASADYQAMLDQFQDSDLSRTDVQESELDGDWDESWVFSGNRDMRYDVSVQARSDHWWIKLSIEVLHDPGRKAYERDAEFYPDGSADELAVYPFTMDELRDWVTGEFVPQTKADILDRIEADVCDINPSRC